MPKTLHDLAEALDVEARASWPAVAVSGIAEDSRRVREGEVFVAIRGTHDDGTRYIDDAIDRGASAIVCEGLPSFEASVPVIRVRDARRTLAALSAAFFDHPTRDLLTVGVTGTNGKTTVCHLSAHLLGLEQTEMIGTVVNENHGLRGLTTPPAPAVQEIARRAVVRGKTRLVVEASSIGLAQRRLDAVAFDVAVFTNLSHDHLDLHGSMDAYFESKATLFRALGQDGLAVVPAQSPWTRRILGQTKAGAMTYAIDGPADLVAVGLALSSEGSRFHLSHRGETAPVDLPHPGRHNVENALAATAVGLFTGLPLQAAGARLSQSPQIPGRFQLYRRSDGVEAIVDFAHTPDALERVLMTARAGHQRVIAVFGCPGEADRAKRPVMGEISGRLADLTVLTSDNPKRESAAEIIEAAAVGVRRSGGHLYAIVDRVHAIEQAVSLAEPGDVILVAGKGHESFQIVGTEYLEYSDAAVLESLGFLAAV